MDNLKIYNAVRSVPNEAKKKIGGGRLKGMTDINPMWRIKCLTELFGVCGVGWKYTITDRWIETCMSKDEITANVTIDLYIKVDGEWSDAIPGIGGSMLVASERNGLYVNDECYKMALTDAISVACKALGMGADVYWQNDNTKYNDNKRNETPKQPKVSKEDLLTMTFELCEEKDMTEQSVCELVNMHSFGDMTIEQLQSVIDWLEKK